MNMKRLIPVAVIAAVALLAAIFFRDSLTLSALEANHDRLIAWRDENYALALGLYMLAYVAVVAFSLPGGLIMTLTGGLLFGTLVATMAIVLAATTGATLIFLAVRYGFGEALAARINTGEGAVARLGAALKQNQISALLLMRLMPVIPFVVANIAPAFLGVPLRHYVWTTFLGIIPGTAVYASVGAGLADLFARGEKPDLGVIFSPPVLLPLLGLCALAALPILIRAIRPKGAL
ncbi:TVP38/TMEM64 family protein [Paracoccaceae bacterium GXU_MW_L88]